MVLVYGNKYVVNKEEWSKEKPEDEDMLVATLDFLDLMQFAYVDEDNNLPEGWYESVFFGIE